VSLKLNVGVSRKVGQPDYGSIGASCNLELEISSDLLERDLDGFQARVRSAYVAAHQVVHDELARLQAPVEVPHDAPAAPPRHTADGHANGNGRPDPQPAGRFRSRKPATENQVRAIRSIARRQNADLDGLIRQEFGVDRPEKLSLKQASELIDIHKTASQIEATDRRRHEQPRRTTNERRTGTWG
jgi:hypothetical protein